MRRMADFPLDILFTTVFCTYMAKDPQSILDYFLKNILVQRPD